MKLKIAIIGASYLQMPLVEKSKELGLETHCFAWEEGAVCKKYVDFFYPVSTVDKEQILELCKRNKINAITSIATDVAVPTVNYVANNLGLIGNNYIDSEATTNKFLMREKLKLFDVASPFYFRVTENIPLEDRDSLSFPLIVKPVDRSGSRGVKKVESFYELQNAIDRAIQESFKRECIIEQYIEGKEVSVETISWEGEHFVLAITDKETTGDPYFVELAHHQPSSLSTIIQEKIKCETKKALNALKIKYGASHSEFKITDDGRVMLIEVGARMGGDFIGSDLVYLSTGYDFVKGVIELAFGNFEVPKINQPHYSGIYFLSAERPHIKSIIENRTLTEIVKAEITDNVILPVQKSADRSGYFIYQSNSKLIV